MTKLSSKEAKHNNPCLQEQEQSFKCLNKHGYDQEKCQEHFDNYNTCKKFWGSVYKDRKAKNIYPYLPNVEEREKIKLDFFKKIRGN